MAREKDLQAVCERLKSILVEYEPRLKIETDQPGNYTLVTPFSEKFQKEVFFAAARIEKNYVSYHLMPVYMFPELVRGISAGLKKRMQGQSCFNFTSIDEELLAELEHLTRTSIERVRQAGIR